MRRVHCRLKSRAGSREVVAQVTFGRQVTQPTHAPLFHASPVTSVCKGVKIVLTSRASPRLTKLRTQLMTYLVSRTLPPRSYLQQNHDLEKRSQHGLVRVGFKQHQSSHEVADMDAGVTYTRGTVFVHENKFFWRTFPRAAAVICH